jgi:NACalpha-BTF3-like transcription factor
MDLASVDRERAEQALCTCNGSVAGALDHLAATKP